MIAMPSMKQRNMTPPITVRRLRVRGAVTGLNRPGQQTAILRPLRTSSSIDEAPFGAKTETAAMVPHIAVRSCNVPVRPSPHDPGALQDRPSGAKHNRDRDREDLRPATAKGSAGRIREWSE